MNSRIIYDLGLHTGKDAEFYLRKGFDVVAVEANSRLAHSTGERLANYVSAGRLKIIEKAIWHEDDQEVPFFVNDEKDDWSSLFKGESEKGVSTSREIRVTTITLAQLFARYGVPYYMKCDLEGGDMLVAQHLIRQSEKPQYVSFEITKLDILGALQLAGYKKYQLVNQSYNHFTQPPNPAREGIFVDARFDGHSSGLFGRDLPTEAWVGFEEIAKIYVDFMDLRRRHGLLVRGWLDIHATY